MKKKSTLFHLGRVAMTLLLGLCVSINAGAQDCDHSWKVTKAHQRGNGNLAITVQCSKCQVKHNNFLATSYTEIEVQNPNKPAETITVYCFTADVPGENFQFNNSYYTNSGDLVVAPLNDNSDNTGLISSLPTDKSIFVFLDGRTLYKDGDWNTICLPFTLTAEQVREQLEPTQLMTLSSTNFVDGTLYMEFTDAQEIEAGKPYIIKWDEGEDIINPMFVGVTIQNGTASSIETDYVTFIGTYNPVLFEDVDKSVMFLGSNNSLYYPEANVSINAFRAYFQLTEGLLCDEPTLDVNSLNLQFSNTEASAIVRINNEKKGLDNDAWYTLNGMRLSKQPTTKGLYIHNGRKVLMK